MNIGFTGTRSGMNDFQKNYVSKLLEEYSSICETAHHGDCVGADTDFHKLVLEKLPNAKLVIHPPVDEELRAFCKDYHEIKNPFTHFARNRNIVDSSDLLIATPFNDLDRKKGGTWYTINYALKKGIDTIIILPDRIEENKKSVEGLIFIDGYKE